MTQGGSVEVRVGSTSHQGSRKGSGYGRASSTSHQGRKWELIWKGE